MRNTLALPDNPLLGIRRRIKSTGMRDGTISHKLGAPATMKVRAQT